MKTKKRILSILLCVYIVLATGCSSTVGEHVETVEGTEDKLKIVTTAFPPYDFARQLAGEQAQIQMLLKPGSEAHNYEPTPQDMIAIQECDVFLYIGGEAEAWVEQVLNSTDNPDMQVLALMDCVEGLEEEVVEGMYVREGTEHDHSHEEESEDATEHVHDEDCETETEHVHHEECETETENVHDEDCETETEHVHDEDCETKSDNDHSHIEKGHAHSGIDEHIWTSPVNVMEISKEITACLVEAKPDCTEEFHQRLADYEKQLQQLDATFREIVNNGNRDKVFFGDRFPFRYLTEEYDLSYYAAFPGCSSESEPSAATMIYLVDKIREEKVPVVFTLGLSSDKIADTLCEETGAEKLVLQDCHNISREDFEEEETYISLMMENAENLKLALE